MKLHELSPVPGSNPKAYRKGRGNGSGNGKTAGRGQKGQWARSGGGVRVGFEGGQMPLARRIPKRGFHNIFAKPLEAVNVSALEKFEDGAVVSACDLLEKGILSKCEHGVKILGEGSLTKKLTVRASAFSASANKTPWVQWRRCQSKSRLSPANRERDSRLPSRRGVTVPSSSRWQSRAQAAASGHSGFPAAPR